MSTQKILALIAFRDEEKLLPGFFSHLREFVAGFLAFDDCSTDQSTKIARNEPGMLEFFERHVPSADHHFEVQNRETLLRAARRHGADWVLCGDADERLETRFLMNLPAIVNDPPAKIIGLRMVAVWENLNQYRLGHSRRFLLFPATDPQPYYPPGHLHLPWFPPALARESRAVLDYHLYHLGSLTRTDRMGRYEKFKRIDPDSKHQPVGYDHLIDESHLVLAPIPPERAFRYE